MAVVVRGFDVVIVSEVGNELLCVHDEITTMAEAILRSGYR